MIIGIIGKKKVGKDTFANYICSNCNEDTFVKMAFADTLKTVCKEIFDLSDSQLHDTIQKDLIDPRWSMSPRQILQFVGTDLFRKHFRESIWIDNMKLKLSKLSSKQNIIFSDIRFQDELDFVLSLSNSEPVHIVEILRPTSDENNDSHSSETNQLTYDFKVSIQNNGSLYSLRQKAKHFHAHITNSL